MLKAVNKIILEINNPDSKYFEKAIFYIRPGNTDYGKLKADADDYISALDNSKRRKTLGWILPLLGIGLLSAGITSVIFLIFIL